MNDCTICVNPGEYEWRLEAAEKNIERLNVLLIGTLVSSISTLVGVVVLLLTK